MSAPAGIVAEFTGRKALVDAFEAARAAGYTSLDAFAPYPVPELAEALGARPVAVQRIAWAAGLTGAAIQFAAQVWMNAVDYPLNVGGRPLNSWPAFLPSALIVAILWAGAATLIGMLALNGLPRLHHPIFAVPNFRRASQDRFFLLVAGDDPRFERQAVRGFLSAQAPVAVRDVP